VYGPNGPGGPYRAIEIVVVMRLTPNSARRENKFLGARLGSTNFMGSKTVDWEL
jgi:hypothetical protein